MLTSKTHHFWICIQAILFHCIQSLQFASTSTFITMVDALLNSFSLKTRKTRQFELLIPFYRLNKKISTSSYLKFEVRLMVFRFSCCDPLYIKEEIFRTLSYTSIYYYLKNRILLFLLLRLTRTAKSFKCTFLAQKVWLRVHLSSKEH